MKSYKPQVSFPQLDQDMLSKWQQEETFKKSIENRPIDKTFTFYDGPPFANGLPHYGHLLANAIKDIVPRYWAMRGCRVERRFGWDCHGFPVESEIEKKNSLGGYRDIVEFGVSKFNEECRGSVRSYVDQWQSTVTRLGRWVDWDNQYHTMDKDFMESVWWVFSQLFEQGMVYKSHKVVSYSPRNATVVSNFEANQNYQNVQDPAVTVKFKLKGDEGYLLIWTTTPWTLPSNLAVAVHPDIQYVKLRDEASGEFYFMAAERVGVYYKKSKGCEIVDTLNGGTLIGKEYEPLFPYFESHPNSFRVLSADYVTVSEGTGIVHQAPAFGEDDFATCRAAGIELVDPLDVNGCFTEEVSDYKGQFVKDADKGIIKDLKARGHIFKHDVIEHSYPFCDRTDTPLIYRAIPAWYVAVENMRENLVKNNQSINWVPSHLRDGRMGKWLENARDWAISRNRFWGTPIPVWVCDQDDSHIEVFGSVGDLEKAVNTKLDDIHKHFIDDLSFECSHCGGHMKRISEVFDCWFESGSMPYAQGHYPFEDKESFSSRFPADFIAEGLDQTRGWFYTLNVLSEALFNKPAFKNVVVNGIICDETGKKMSKRHRNYTPPMNLLEKFGADSVRLYMVNSPLLKGENLIFTDQGVRDTTRAVLLPLWNAFSFLTTYAEADGWIPGKDQADGKPSDSQVKLDRWIVSRLQSTVFEVNQLMGEYKLYAVVPKLLQFIDELTNWYIRLSRRRFWGADQKQAEDKEAAYKTLYFVLLQFSKLFAPFAPFISEKIYKGLTDDAGVESVHLCDLPSYDEKLRDLTLEREMSLVQQATNLGRQLRAKHQIKTRQPLRVFTVVSRSEDDLTTMKDSIGTLKAELNVKEIAFSTEEHNFVELSVKPNLKKLGPKLGSKIGALRKSMESLQADQLNQMINRLESGKSVEIAGEDLILEDFFIERKPKGKEPVMTAQGITVSLNTNLDDELVREGIAREVVNRVQNFRKDSGLDVSDRIHLSLQLGPNSLEAVRDFKDYVASEVLASKLELGSEFDLSPYAHKGEFDLDQESCKVGLSIEH